MSQCTTLFQNSLKGERKLSKQLFEMDLAGRCDAAEEDVRTHLPA